MSDLKKFLFDLNDFDEDAIAKKLAEEEPPAPSFSEEELDQAKAEAYQKGRLSGIDEERNNILEKIHITLTDFPRAINELLSLEQERYERFINDSIAMTLDALKKTFPELYDINHVTDLKKALTSHITEQVEANTLIILVHETLKAEIEKHIGEVFPEHKSSIQIKGSKDITIGHMTMKWNNGGAVWQPTDIHTQIIDILQHHIDDHYQIISNNEKDDKTPAKMAEEANQDHDITAETISADDTLDDKAKSDHNDKKDNETDLIDKPKDQTEHKE